MKRHAFLAVPLLLWAAGVAAQSLPRLTQPVNDFARIIDADSARELDVRIRALERATRDAIVVATVDTIEPYGSIEEYAVKLFEQAGIGQRGRDNGVLVLVAKNERRVRIEVGYDLEEFVPDGFAGDVIRQQMLPAFRNGNYGSGLLAGTTRLIARIAERRGVTLSEVPAAAPPSSGGRGGFAILPIIIVIAVIILVIMRSGGGPTSGYRRPRGPWGGWFGGPFIGGFGRGGFGGGGFGRGGGGFGGFGGGMSGGGGASGGW